MKRTVQITLQMEVHPMSRDDLKDEGIDLAEDETPDMFVEEADLDEIAMAIADYVTSDENEALAGSNQFVTLEKADFLRTEWVPNAPDRAA